MALYGADPRIEGFYYPQDTLKMIVFTDLQDESATHCQLESQLYRRHGHLVPRQT